MRYTYAIVALVTARPPVLLIHGTEDDLIPVDALHLDREQLAQAGVEVEWHVREGLGHGIDPVGRRLAGRLMARRISGQRASR